MPVTLAMFYQEFMMKFWFYHIDIPGIINLCFYRIIVMYIIVYSYTYTKCNIKSKQTSNFVFIKFNPYFWQICE